MRCHGTQWKSAKRDLRGKLRATGADERRIESLHRDRFYCPVFSSWPCPVVEISTGQSVYIGSFHGAANFQFQTVEFVAYIGIA